MTLTQSGTLVAGDLAITTTNAPIVTTHYPLTGTINGSTLTLSLTAVGNPGSPFVFVAPVTRQNGGLLTQGTFASQANPAVTFGAGIFVRP
jgi:hypothetical protein